MLIQIIGESLLVTALLLFTFVVYKYNKHNKELELEIDEFQREFDAYMAEWQAKSGEDYIWN